MIREKLTVAWRRYEVWFENKKQGLLNRLEERQDRLQEYSAADRDESEVRPLVENAQGESIQPVNLFQKLDDETVPYDLLDEGEQPHYFLGGTSLDVEGNGAGGESITGWDRDRRIGSAYTLLTEQRVLIVANHLRGYDHHTVPYDSISSVNLNTGLTSTRLSLQTRSATYHLSVTASDEDEVKDAVEWLRARRRQGNESASNNDPIDRLEKLKELHEDDVLTDEEFEEKKSSILSDV
jgi:hypothetical protein